MLAVVWMLEEWRHFIEGAEHQCEIWTDHNNMEYFITAKKLNCWQAWWPLLLTWFDFVMHHRPGKSMGKPDALSHWADHDSGSSDNENMILLTPDCFAIHALQGLEVIGEEWWWVCLVLDPGIHARLMIYDSTTMSSPNCLVDQHNRATHQHKVIS